MSKKPEEEDVDSLLPPGAMASEKSSIVSGTAGSSSENADELLPPGASDSGGVGASLSQVAIPSDDDLAKDRRTEDGSILISTADGEVAIKTPVKKVVGPRGEERELVELTPEQKAKRRLIRNVIVWGFCAIVLTVTMLMFVWMGDS